MRFLACLDKTLRENLREWKVLVLALAFGPAFVFIMAGYFRAAAPAYGLEVLDRDGSEGSRALVAAWREARHAGGEPMFSVGAASDLDSARAKVRSRDADLLVEIPAGFGRALDDFRDRRSAAPAPLLDHADERNARGAMAVALADYVAFGFAAQRGAAPLPLDVAVRPVGAGRPLTEFELFVPALLVLAIIMVLFTAAASLVREVDRRTLTRLMLSRLGVAEYVAALAVSQVLIGVAALALAWVAALACGFHGEGSLATLLVVGAAGTLGVVALAVLTSAFLDSMFELLTVGTFPFFVLMFFSECMFPLPKIAVANVAGHTLYANDVLPTALCTRAFSQVLNHGAGLGGVAFELAAMLVLTAAYFALGGWLFRRRHLTMG